ncbi:MAG TPA: hypothetical protein VMT12_02560 [Syntrophales bacterium]|nr:hypothetical protein [Syntrophales bacterium]
MVKRYLVLVLIFFLPLIPGCQKASVESEKIKEFPINSMDGVITRSDVTFDKSISSDGNGSLRIDVSQPTTIRLFEVRDINIENARLTYRARIKTENVRGQAYLEMWCVFPGMGEYFSRSLQSPLSGTLDWTTQETPFFLQKGQKPELVKLNVVINGQGTVWVDDISLLKGPLK